MRSCSTCGSNVPRQARFCQACGAPTVDGLLAERPEPVPPAAPKRKFSWTRLMVVGVSVLALTGTVAAAAASALGGG